MIQFLIALALLMGGLYLIMHLNNAWQKRVKVVFWIAVWSYPVLYLIYASDPENFWWTVGFLGVVALISIFSFFWEGGFRTVGSGDDDPSGNSNITKNFTDHM